MSYHTPTRGRIRLPGYPPGDEYNGAFMISTGLGQVALRVIASNGGGWEHVSVSTERRCPTWDEMCFVKSLFWDEEDAVVQFHPPKRAYINYHPFTLHLWRKVGAEFEMPPSIMVGPKE
jgi:hypothetical protein